MTETLKPKVFIGVPSYDGRINMAVPNGIYGCTSRGVLASLQFGSQSWLTRNFNNLYAQALNERATKGITHFLMWHEDIEIATRNWLDTMFDLMFHNHADVLSVVVPIKTMDGLTSTALDETVGDYDPYWRVRRLTMHEVYNDYPSTFTAPNLLVNTGLMLVDIRKEWAEKVWFEFDDKILRDEKTGKFKAVGVPEDWNFSRKALRLGAKLWATREVTVIHHGRHQFGNERAWGTEKTDR